MITDGMKSSEFVLAILTWLTGAAMVFFGAKTANTDLLNNGLYLILGGSVGHGLSRGLAKFGTSPTKPDAATPTDAAAAAAVIAKIP